MAYRCMKLVVNNERNLLKLGEIEIEEWELFKKDCLDKIDVFLACNRITSKQYKELYDLIMAE